MKAISGGQTTAAESRFSPPAGISKLAILLAAAVLFTLLIRFTPLGEAIGDLKSARHAHGGFQYELRFFLLASLLVGAGVPRLLICGAAGMIFGFANGFAVATAASLTGSFACFHVIRWSGGEWVRHRLGGLRWFGKMVAGAPSFWSVCMIRQLPVGNLLINGALALSRTGNFAFLIGSLLGFAPQGVVATLIGSGSAKSSAGQGMAQLASAAILLIGAAIWWGGRKAQVHGIPDPS